MKRNKGIAMVYTVMTMLLVFAICMVITTIMLAQITYSKTYSQKSENDRLYSQIGDLFYGSKGNFFDYDIETDDLDKAAKTAPFAKALAANHFNMEKLHVVKEFDLDAPEGKTEIWEGVKYNDVTFTFSLDQVKNDYTLIVYLSGDSRAQLTVTIKVEDGNAEIIHYYTGGD